VFKPETGAALAMLDKLTHQNSGMKTFFSGRKRGGFTFIDLMIVVVIVGLMAILVMSMMPMTGRGARASRINCVSNLKQVGLAFRMWSNDHGDRFPMAVSITQTGSLEYIQTGEVYRHFQVISNELYSPKILVCSDDKSRVRANVFGSVANATPFASNKNLSYFVGLDADETQPNMMLAGDRNVTGGVMTNGSIMLFEPNTPAGWTKDIHNRAGNIGLADGSVSQATEEALRRQIKADTNEVIRLAIPLTK
jgi:prepilin-type processing-associated H-X9-DG protein